MKKLKLHKIDNRYYRVACIAMLLAASCAGPTTPPQTLNPSTLGVSVGQGGSQFEFTSVAATATDDVTDLVIVATQDPNSSHFIDEVTITVPKPLSLPFTYQAPPDALAKVTYFDAQAQIQYYAESDKGYCSITITQVSPTVQGIFTANEISDDGRDTVRLVNGEFNATYK